MVSALPLNNNLGLGEKSPSLSLGVYYNSIRVDKNIIVKPFKYNEHYMGQGRLIFGVFLDDTCCNNSMHLKKGKII